MVNQQMRTYVISGCKLLTISIFMLLSLLQPLLAKDNYLRSDNTSIQDEINAIDRMADALLSDLSSNTPRLPTSERKPPTPPSENDIIMQRLQRWAQAWSKGDAEQYIGFYAPDYSPVKMSRNSWLASRKKNITARKKIQVALSEINVIHTQNPETIITRFKQKYRSIHYQDTTYKLLRWKKINGQWYISKEIIIKE